MYCVIMEMTGVACLEDILVMNSIYRDECEKEISIEHEEVRRRVVEICSVGL